MADARQNLERGQRAAAVTAAHFREDDIGARVLLQAFAEEDVRGVPIGYYELTRLGLGWLAAELGAPPRAVAADIERNLANTVREKAQHADVELTELAPTTSLGSWTVQEYAAGILALRHTAADLHAAGPMARSLRTGFASDRDVIVGYQIASWAIAQELADVWVVHPEVVCQRLALKLAEEAGAT